MLIKSIIIAALAAIVSSQYGPQIAYVPILIHNVTNNTGYLNNTYRPQPQPTYGNNNNGYQPQPIYPNNNRPGPPPNNIRPGSPPNNNFRQNNTNQTTGWNNTGGCVPHDFDIKGANSFFAGCQLNGDAKAYSMVIDKPKRLFEERVKVIEFPGEKPLGHVTNEIITAINCYHLKIDGKSSCRIERGGIGQRFVKLYLTTGVSRARLYYKVEIFTRRV